MIYIYVYIYAYMLYHSRYIYIYTHIICIIYIYIHINTLSLRYVYIYIRYHAQYGSDWDFPLPGFFCKNNSGPPVSTMLPSGENFAARTSPDDLLRECR